jgi:hypothetical protein
VGLAFHQRQICGLKRLALRAEESLGLRSGLLAGELKAEE